VSLRGATLRAPGHSNRDDALSSWATDLPRAEPSCNVWVTILDVVVRRYCTSEGREPFTEWLSKLGDRQARARILVRLERLAVGNFGDAKLLRQGVWELRIDFGPGYRVYFGREGGALVILLCAGDKRSQDADIKRAIDLWQEYERRRNPKSGGSP